MRSSAISLRANLSGDSCAPTQPCSACSFRPADRNGSSKRPTSWPPRTSSKCTSAGWWQPTISAKRSRISCSRSGCCRSWDCFSLRARDVMGYTFIVFLVLVPVGTPARDASSARRCPIRCSEARALHSYTIGRKRPTISCKRPVI